MDVNAWEMMLKMMVDGTGHNCGEIGWFMCGQWTVDGWLYDGYASGFVTLVVG